MSLLNHNAIVTKLDGVATRPREWTRFKAKHDSEGFEGGMPSETQIANRRAKKQLLPFVVKERDPDLPGSVAPACRQSEIDTNEFADQGERRGFQ